MGFVNRLHQGLTKKISTWVGFSIIIAGTLATVSLLVWQPEVEVDTGVVDYAAQKQRIGDEATDLNDRTEDWKIYRNEGYGFEIKYPPEWKLSDMAGFTSKKFASKTIFAIERERETQPAYLGYREVIRVTVYQNNEGETLEEFVNRKVKATGSIYRQESYRTHNDYSSFEGVVINTGIGNVYEVFFMRDSGSKHIFEVNLEPIFDEMTIREFQYILSTVRFLDLPS